MSWQESKSYDEWKLNPPEPPESLLKCDQCGAEFQPGDRIYEIECENLCENCADAWLNCQWRYVEESECYERNL